MFTRERLYSHLRQLGRSSTGHLGDAQVEQLSLELLQLLGQLLLLLLAQLGALHFHLQIIKTRTEWSKTENQLEHTTGDRIIRTAGVKRWARPLGSAVPSWRPPWGADDRYFRGFFPSVGRNTYHFERFANAKET